mmetsp:Transcript_3294/g.5981  ORF Transcript_3294/g.5981 Transcript_3294/m.5981 type:complete len:357 (+) Transcript_3294:1432-2502(+)
MVFGSRKVVEKVVPNPVSITFIHFFAGSWIYLDFHVLFQIISIFTKDLVVDSTPRRVKKCKINMTRQQIQTSHGISRMSGWHYRWWHVTRQRSRRLVKNKVSILVAVFQNEDRVALHEDQFIFWDIVQRRIVCSFQEFGSVRVDTHDFANNVRGDFPKRNRVSSASTKGIENDNPLWSSIGTRRLFQRWKVRGKMRHPICDMICNDFGRHRVPALRIELASSIETRKETTTLRPVFVMDDIRIVWVGDGSINNVANHQVRRTLHGELNVFHMIRNASHQYGGFLLGRLNAGRKLLDIGIEPIRIDVNAWMLCMRLDPFFRLKLRRRIPQIATIDNDSHGRGWTAPFLVSVVALSHG